MYTYSFKHMAAGLMDEHKDGNTVLFLVLDLPGHVKCHEDVIILKKELAPLEREGKGSDNTLDVGSDVREQGTREAGGRVGSWG
jgi:hypothetical protein